MLRQPDNSQNNGKNDVSLILTIHYDGEESAALTATALWELPAFNKVTAWLGLFRGTVSIENITFRQLLAPGIRIIGFTDKFATFLENTAEGRYMPKAKKAFAPILREYRDMVHHGRATERDSYFGVDSNARRIS